MQPVRKGLTTLSLVKKDILLITHVTDGLSGQPSECLASHLANVSARFRKMNTGHLGEQRPFTLCSVKLQLHAC